MNSNSNTAPDTMSTVIDNGNNVSYHLNNLDDEEFEEYVTASPSYICTDNFQCVEDEQEQMYCRSAYNSITQLELWDWIKRNNGPFMINRSNEMELLKKRMAQDEINSYHSGASYGFIMQRMELIAKEGYEKFRQMYLECSR